MANSTNLNAIEKYVFGLIFDNIKGSDNGCEYDDSAKDIAFRSNGLSVAQIKGYLGSLEKKGLIKTFDYGDSYYFGRITRKGFELVGKEYPETAAYYYND